MAKFANGITHRTGIPTIREVGDPANAVALAARSGRSGLFCSDLPHALTDLRVRMVIFDETDNMLSGPIVISGES
jgi:hypothetical protein